MKGEILTPENVQVVTMAALGLYAMSFTFRQRMWVRRRDRERCQAEELRIDHECNGSRHGPEDKRKLQVHHVIPQRYAERVGIQNPDFPENGLTLCERFHQNIVHPDMTEALAQYRGGDKGAFSKALKRRDKAIDRREVYWNDQHDRAMRTQAVKNTQRYQGENPDDPFPPKHEKRNRKRTNRK